MTYSVPTMAETLKASKQTGFRCASTFSGGGGSCMGMKMAGFAVPWANEFVDAARDIRALNFPDEVCDGRDIREVQPADVLDSIGIDVGELDLFNGSPPCNQFSMVGSRDDAWGQVKKYYDKEQRVDDLTWEWIRLLAGLQPRAFVMENVAGLVSGRAKGMFKKMLVDLREAGYAVKAGLVQAEWLGVPQARKRVIFVGFRNDLALEPRLPKPFPKITTMADALPHLSADHHALEVGDPKYKDKSGGFMRGKIFRLTLPSPTITAVPGTLGGVANHRVITFSSGYKDGKVVDAPFPDIPNDCYDLDGSRRLSIGEAAALSSFPADYNYGELDYGKRWARLGLSVPPLMMRAVALEIRKQLESYDAR